MYKINIGSGYPEKFGVSNTIERLSQYSEIVTSNEEADFFLFPVFYEILFEYNDNEYKNADFKPDEIIQLKKQFRDMVNAAVNYKRKIIIFYYRDPVTKINVPNAVIFRTSFFASDNIKNQYAMPAFRPDFLKEESIAFTAIKKTVKPTVGFRGQAITYILFNTMVKMKINTILRLLGIKKELPLYFNIGYLARKISMDVIKRNKRIQSDFYVTNDSNNAPLTPLQYKNEFVSNLTNNQYNICVSGHGNYSFRLYETMCAGRIPVFINTDCVLPFEEFIDWKKHVIWIENIDIHHIDRTILKFHQSISDEDFLKLQQSSRQLWEKYFSSDGFFLHLHKYFEIINDIK